MPSTHLVRTLMDLLDNNNSLIRSRTDSAFKWGVRLAGFLVILTFIALILTLVYRAAPLLYSPQINLTEQHSLPEGQRVLHMEQLGIAPIISYAEHATTSNLCILSAWNEQDLRTPITTHELACSAGIAVVEYQQSILAFYIENKHVNAVIYQAGNFKPAPEFSIRLPSELTLAGLADVTVLERVKIINDTIILDTPVGLWRSSLPQISEFQPVPQVRFLPESDYSAIILGQANQLVFSNESALVIQSFNGNAFNYPISGELIRLQPSHQPTVFYAQIVAPDDNAQPLLSLIQFSLNLTEYSGLTLDSSVLLSVPYLSEEHTRLSVGENDIHNIFNIFSQTQTNRVLTMLNSVTGETLTSLSMPTSSPQSQLFSFGREGIITAQGAQLQRYQFTQLTSAITYDELFLPQTYIGYSQPAQHWQTNPSLDFQDRKYNVMPLLIGSVKVSLLALIVAIPLAMGCAVYVGYFAPVMVQRTLKPFIEVLEAIPSVAIGLIAAVWLAPLAESFLLSFIVFVCLLPMLLLISRGVFVMCRRLGVKHWYVHAELGIQVCLILGLVWVCFFALVTPMAALFIEYQTQMMPINKSTLVVGIAMGIAISPTIFSLAEDAISGVPRARIKAAAALGATRLQTLTYIILPAATPGLIAAMMIGLGRAFGETMIVLMVTGNTPIANWDLFAGLRALSANLVIELPEANQSNSHLTVLFITALLLFLFTFALNSIAALIKHQQSQMLRGAND